MCLRMESGSNGSCKMVKNLQVPEKERTFLTRSATISLRLMDFAMDFSSEKAYPNMIVIFQVPSFANVCPSTVFYVHLFQIQKKILSIYLAHLTIRHY